MEIKKVEISMKNPEKKIQLLNKRNVRSKEKKTLGVKSKLHVENFPFFYKVFPLKGTFVQFYGKKLSNFETGWHINLFPVHRLHGV